MTQKISRFLLAFLLLFFLTLPFFLLLNQVSLTDFPNSSELFTSFLQTFIQSALSTVVVLAFGFLGALGLLSSLARPWMFHLCLIPNFVPPIFVLLALFNVFRPFGFFPFGLWGIVGVHAFINIGLVSAILSFQLEKKIQQSGEWAYLSGASSWLWLKTILQGSWGREVSLIGLFVFSVCWTSFAVPLLAGGEFKTLEILMYEKLRLHQSLSQAFWVGLFQSAFLLLFVGLLWRPEWKRLVETKGQFRTHLRFWPSRPWGLVFALLPSTLVALGLIVGWIESFGSWQRWGEPMMTILGPAIMGTLALAFLSALSILLFTTCIVYIYPFSGVMGFLRSYLAPSPVLTGLAFFILIQIFDITPLIWLSVALSICLLPLLFRLILEQGLMVLRSQVQVAEQLGASPWLIFLKIKWPLLKKEIFICAMLTAIWASGDFALSRVMMTEDLHLAMFVQSLMSGYHLSAANALSFVLFALIFLIYRFAFLPLGGLRYVDNQRPL